MDRAFDDQEDEHYCVTHANRFAQSLQTTKLSPKCPSDLAPKSKTFLSVLVDDHSTVSVYFYFSFA